ncbi:MAG: site-2 protease family protein [Candidatus Micrarchaeia archaeon]|jgi:Zn-dependent protease
MDNSRLDFSETVQIIVSALGIALAFSYVWKDQSFIDILFTVGTAFVLHELGHRYMAIKYGAHARYQMWTIGLVACVILAVAFDFVFAAPGAVYIYGRELTRQQSGKVALAGPAVNLGLCLLFYFGALTFTAAGSLFLIGARVNAFLAAFNLIPMDPFDGAKVMRWNNTAWAAAFVVSAMLVIMI